MRHALPVGFLLLLAPAVLTGLASCRRQGTPQEASGTTPVPLPAEVDGWRAAGEATRYDVQSIYEYIDGHAEVYLAYGLRSCLSRRYAGPAGEADLVVDVFELASPSDAYGVFTYDRDGEPVGIGRDSLFRYGWLSLWKGSYFVSIVTERETARSKRAAVELGRAVAATLPDEGRVPALVADLPPDGLDAGSVRFLRHPQILNTHVFVSDENVLRLGPDTAAVLGTYRRDGARAYLLLVDYVDEARAAAALQGFRSALLDPAAPGEPTRVEGRGYFAARQTGARVAAVIRADTPDLARRLRDEAATAKGGDEHE